MKISGQSAIIAWLRKIGRVMKKEIHVFDVRIDLYTAKEAMQKAMEYMETEPANGIDMINGNVLMSCAESEELKEYLSQMDMVLPREKNVLEAAGITDSGKIREAYQNVFLKMFLRYLHKNRKRVFLLASADEKKDAFEQYLKKHYSGIQIMDAMVVSGSEQTDDMIINRINGAEAECVLAALPSPVQEGFFCRSRALLNVKLYAGLGEYYQRPDVKNGRKFKIADFFYGKLLQREVARWGKEN